MDNQIQKTDKTEIAQISVNKSTKLLLNAIHKADVSVIYENLSAYKSRGEAQPLAVIDSVPRSSRIPGLVSQYGRGQISAVIAVALTGCFEKLNVKASMNGSQIVELAEMLIDSSEEDYFAIEDLMLFMQGLAKGDYGIIYNRMDSPTFFELFEKYRQRRHIEYIHRQEEIHAQRKCQGSESRSSEDFSKEIEAIRVAKSDYYRQKWSD